MSQIKKANASDPSALGDEKTIEHDATIEEPFTVLDPELDLVVVGGGKCASSMKSVSK